MEFAFEFCSTVPMLIVRHSGAVTKKDVQAYISAMLELPEREKCLFQLNDFSGLEQIDLDFRKVWSVSEAAKKLYPPTRHPVKVAFYAPSDISFGFARMYCSLMEGTSFAKFDAFHCVQEAWHWFGVSEPSEWSVKPGSVA